jgi:hypothetical protein
MAVLAAVVDMSEQVEQEQLIKVLQAVTTVHLFTHQAAVVAVLE